MPACFSLPDTEADFAATVQQFGMAAIVELLIAFALIAWEMLRPAPQPVTAPSKETEEQPVQPTKPPTSFKALPKPKLVSSRARAGSVSDYVLARLEAAKGCEIEFGDAYADYTAWCGTRCSAPLSPELFAEAMKRLCEKARVRVRRKAGSAVFIGLRLVGVGSTATAMATNRTFSATQHFLPLSEDERKRSAR